MAENLITTTYPPELTPLLEINARGKLTENDGLTRIGFGVELTDPDLKEISVTIPDDDRSGHFGCFGTTRIGKTRLIENIVKQDIRKGYNVCVIDPKGDADLFSSIVQTAAESGRLEELLLLTPIFPDLSIRLNPLSYYYMEDELVDHVVSTIKAKEDYYISVASEVSQAIIEGFGSEGKNQGRNKLKINFQDIKKKSDYESIKKFQAILQGLPPNEEIRDLIENIQQILNSTQDHFSKVSSSMRATLASLTTGSAGKVIGKARHDEFIKRLEEGRRVIFFCNTGSMLARRTAHIIGKVTVSMIQALLGRFYASSRRRLNPPLCVHADEGHDILYDGIHDLFAKAGGANVWVHFYTQSIAEIVKEIGRDAAQSIIDNINTWVYMRVNHPETAMHIEEASPILNTTESLVSFGGGVTMRPKEERMIRCDKVMRLPKRNFYLRTYKGLYKGITDDCPDPYINMRFPNINVDEDFEDEYPEQEQNGG